METCVQEDAIKGPVLPGKIPKAVNLVLPHLPQACDLSTEALKICRSAALLRIELSPGIPFSRRHVTGHWAFGGRPWFCFRDSAMGQSFGFFLSKEDTLSWNS